MNAETLRSPLIRRAVDAINQGKLDDFMALFAADATVVDGATYIGHQVIRSWAQRETFSTHVHFQVEHEHNAEGAIIAGNVRSHGGYNGPATFSCTLRGDLIERLGIT